ncbi:MAG: GntP family transporter [Succinivibrio sp.]|nr:GntP family transporter [Succinivibrio sp.]
MSTTALLLVAILAVAILLFLVIKLKLSAFVSLLLVSLLTALMAGIPIDKIMPTMIAGMGGTLGAITIIVGLGAILGHMISVSGGAEALTRYFAKVMGMKRTVAALTVAGFILGIPIFVDVGFIILVPIVLGFAAISKARPMVYGLPVVTAMLAVHVVVPPHPGPVAAAGILSADVGMLTILGLLVCVPTAIVGYFTAKFVLKRYLAAHGETVEIPDTLPEMVEHPENETGGKVPNVWLVVALILIPIGLIMIGTVANTTIPHEGTFYKFTQLIGNPGCALLLTLILAFYFLGIKRGWSTPKIGQVMDDALPAAAVVIMVTGGGGVFGKVLVESGVGAALAEALNSVGMHPIVAGFVIAAALRASQGSATVAILTAAGLLTNAVDGWSDTQRVLLTMSIGFGALGFSHINDSLFWILTKYLKITVADGLKTWTVITSITGITGFVLTYLLYSVMF